jgi:hypothetical protein
MASRNIEDRDLPIVGIAIEGKGEEDCVTSIGQTMRAKFPDELRFEARWHDYLSLLDDGTHPDVGVREPRPPDRRSHIAGLVRQWAASRATPPDSSDTQDAVKGVPKRSGEILLSADQWSAANALLDEQWAEDIPLWPRRLHRFLTRLSPTATRHFGFLAREGFQPDALALEFHRATQTDEFSEQEARVRSEVEELGKLLKASEEALFRLLNRKTQFDEYLQRNRLRVIPGEPGSAELKVLVDDFQTWASAEREDHEVLRRKIDGRREPLSGHALVRLSRRVKRSTGAYHDAKVARITNDLWESQGRGERTSTQNLKMRRYRWQRSLGSQ